LKNSKKEDSDRAKERRQQQNRLRRNSVPGGRSAFPSKFAKPPPISLDDLEKNLETKENLRSRVVHEDAGVIEENLDDIRKLTDINSVATLQQSLTQTTILPKKTSQILPKRKLLLTRRSKYCSKCDKLLIKPDLNSTKIEFKRQHIAISYIPKFSIASLFPISATGESMLNLKISNPVHSIMTITIKKHPFSGQTAEVDLNLESTFLSPKDHDDEDENIEIKSLKSKDEKVIIERKSNWMTMQLPIKIKSDVAKFILEISAKFKGTSGDQSCSFLLNFNISTSSFPKVKK